MMVLSTYYFCARCSKAAPLQDWSALSWCLTHANHLGSCVFSFRSGVHPSDCRSCLWAIAGWWWKNYLRHRHCCLTKILFWPWPNTDDVKVITVSWNFAPPLFPNRLRLPNRDKPWRILNVSECKNGGLPVSSTLVSDQTDMKTLHHHGNTIISPHNVGGTRHVWSPFRWL